MCHLHDEVHRVLRVNTAWFGGCVPRLRPFSCMTLFLSRMTALFDRLEKRGLPHQPSCPLCKCQAETARHIMFECRYSRRIWRQAVAWLSCPSLVQDLGSGRQTVLQYWQAAALSPTAHPQGLKSAITLITWELWKERNARVFNNKATMPSTLMQKIKDESKNWILAGAKHLAQITS